MSDALATTAAEGPALDQANESFPRWRALAWFTLFRMLLAAGLILVFVAPPGVLWRGTTIPPLSVLVLLTYCALILLAGLLVYLRWPKKQQQVQIAVFVDIVAFTLLMHAGGGVASGLGLLLAIAVAAGSLLMEGRLSLLFAAFATLGVIAQQASVRLYLGAETQTMTHAGLLGVTFFTVALLGHVLYRRIRTAEEIAARRQVDIADLSKLNEFIIRNMGMGVLAVDGDRNLRVINAAARQLLGEPESAEGETLYRLAPTLATWLRQHATGAARLDDTLQINGRSITVELHLLGARRASGALIFLRDREEVLQEAQQIKLAALGRLTASIAHNIRNPLSSVSHAGQLLAESHALGDEDLRLLAIIRRNTGRINEIIESVMDLSRRDRGEARPLNLTTWLADFCADYREVHGLPSERLRFQHASEDLSVTADPRHLHQILSNLSDNALQHAGHGSEPPHVELNARRDAPHGRVVVEIDDDGPGIAPDVAREIFTPFFTTSVKGTGLGLYIAKELSEANGIQLEYISQPKQGSRFRLTFPDQTQGTTVPASEARGTD